MSAVIRPAGGRTERPEECLQIQVATGKPLPEVVEDGLVYIDREGPDRRPTLPQTGRDVPK
jgi:hypothetical protein